MAQTLSEGLVVPNSDGGEDISFTGVAEVRLLGSTTNTALQSKASVIQIATDGDLDTATKPGQYGFWGSTANTPTASAGTLVVMEILNNTGGVAQVNQTAYQGTQIWTRFRGSLGWSAWTQIDAGAVDVSAMIPSVPPVSSSTAWRTVPLALTVGGAWGLWDRALNGGVRMPVRFAAKVHRYRVHLRNFTTRTGVPGSAAVSVPGVWIGGRSGSRITSPVQIASGLSSTGEDMVTPWVTTPLEADTDYMLAFTHSSTGQTLITVGGCWTTTTGDATAAVDGTSHVRAPLDVWIEAEVAPDVPILAAFGDSLSSGITSTVPVYDSWLSQWARANGALPVHYTGSGYTMDIWPDAAPGWTRWQELDRPDAVVFAMGSNDVFGTGATLAGTQAKFAEALRQVRKFVSPVVYATTILPRTSVTGAAETMRRSYNTWLPSSGARQVFNIVPAVSTDDETLMPAFDVDGIHLNTAGYAAIAGVIPASVLPAPAASGPTVDWSSAIDALNASAT